MPEDVSILQIIANQIAINIDNARLFAQTESRLNEARILYEYNSLLSSTLDVGELQRRAARALTTWLQAARCTIFSWEPEENSVTAQVDFIYDLTTGAIDQFGLNLETHDLAKHPTMQRALSSGKAKVWHLTDEQLDESEKQQLTKPASIAISMCHWCKGAQPQGLYASTAVRDKLNSQTTRFS